VAQWRRNGDEGVPAELLDFSPDDWVLGGSSSPERARLALDRWYAARWEWVSADQNRRKFDWMDVI
jgi:hypothetical protein